MHRTIGDSYGLDGGKRIFREESVGNWDATQYQANDATAMQEEIARVIEDGGIALNTPPEATSAMNQMSTVIQNYISTEAFTRNANDRVLSGALCRTEINDINTDYADTKLENVGRVLGSVIQGFRISRLATSVFIYPGFARTLGSDTGIARLTSMLEKITGTWVLGDGNGGVPSTLLPLVADTWYHVFVIKRESDGVVDGGIDIAINASNLLADSSFDSYRRVGSVYWESTLNFRPFTHNMNEDYFLHDFTEEDFDSTVAIPGITTVTLLKGVPPGLELPVDLMLHGSGITTAWQLSFWDGIYGAISRAGNSQYLWGASGEQDWGAFRVICNTSQQIFAEGVAGTTPLSLVANVRGYLDKRWVAPF